MTTERWTPYLNESKPAIEVSDNSVSSVVQGICIAGQPVETFSSVPASAEQAKQIEIAVLRKTARAEAFNQAIRIALIAAITSYRSERNGWSEDFSKSAFDAVTGIIAASGIDLNFDVEAAYRFLFETREGWQGSVDDLATAILALGRSP